ncbi:MAG: hypothetical protein GXP32_08650 [Kiritimatiellaeota bacterium]|nr:hypothetical protein [Kiritimatiellota bacterium]
MIVKMLKTTVICLKMERESALERLRELGLMHIDAAPIEETADRSESSARLADLEKAFLVLDGVKPAEKTESTLESVPDGDALAEAVVSLSNEKLDGLKEFDDLRKDRELLIPWGEFSADTLNSLNEKGIEVHLCQTSRELFEDLKTKTAEADTEKGGTAAFHILRQNKHEVYFALIATRGLDVSELPLARLPENLSITETESAIESIESRIKAIDKELAELAPLKNHLKKRSAELAERLEFLEKRDSMAESGVVAHITGFIPEPETDNLKQAAKKQGWGLYLIEPDSDDNTPTFIKVPKFLEISKPIFDFIGISPGYYEWDVSTCFLFFLTIFVGIIVGDAGYGLIFLVLAILAKLKLKSSEKTDQALNLMILLSLSIIVWGALNGTYFALRPDLLPKWMRGLDWFTDPQTKNQHIQQLCFLIAAIHLSLAHLWKATLYINSRKALGEIGWAMFIWGNYFMALNLIVYPDVEWPVKLLTVLYCGGALLTAGFAVNWKDVGDVCNYPFGLIGTFVDLLSYIRLFAVGLATYYIADSFNNMGMMLLGAWDNAWAAPFLLLVAVVVILFGHILNVLLAGLAILVHGIRLNTLEFSNHMSLQWLGRVYAPFKKHDEE